MFQNVLLKIKPDIIFTELIRFIEKEDLEIIEDLCKTLEN
jgi:hypothetical protein